MKNNLLKLCVGMVILSFASQGLALRDPTRPPINVLNKILEKHDKGKRLILKSIIHSKKRQLAVINGKTLAHGDIIFGNTVVKIEKTRVILKKGEHETVLTLTGKE